MGTDRMRLRRVIVRGVLGIVLAACVNAPAAAPATAPSGPSASPSPPAPSVTLDGPRDPHQAPRYVSGRWSSSIPVADVAIDVSPPLPCTARVDPARASG